MVTGLDNFALEFKEHKDNFIVIGGTACQLNLEETVVEPRETVDIDIILIVENMTPEFGRHFWQYVTNGKYQNKQRRRGEGKEPVPELFRFLSPELPGYPKQIELLSVVPDVLAVPEGFYLTPIPIGEEIPSLSAIIMNRDFYDFTIAHSIERGGLRVADPIALICLKAAAFVNLSIDKEQGNPHVQSHHIRKHRDDVFKLVAAYGGQYDPVSLPHDVKGKIEAFISRIEALRHDSGFVKSMQLVHDVAPDMIDQYIETLKSSFVL